MCNLSLTIESRNYRFAIYPMNVLSSERVRDDRDDRVFARLHEFLRSEKGLEMVHLPKPRQTEHPRLSHSPPQNAAVRRFAGRSEALLPVSLIILLLRDLLHLIQQLTNSQLQLGQLILGRDLSVIVGVFAHLDVEMNSELPTAEPRGGVGMKADDMFAWKMTGECESAL